MRFLRCLIICLVVLIGSVSDAAIHMTDLLVSGANARLSDNSLEVLWNVDPAGGYMAPGAGDTTLDLGDRLITIARIDQLTAPFPGGTTFTFPADWDNEFTVVSVIETFTKVPAAGGGPTTFTFIPATSADDPFGFGGGGVLGLGWVAGSMIATYDDPANDFSGAPASIAAGIAEAALGGPPIPALPTGTAYWEMGFIGELGEFWSALTLSDDLSILGALPAGTAGGFFSFALNETALNSAPDKLVSTPLPDIIGSGNVVSPGPASPGPPFPNPALGGYQLLDNVDITVNVVIPEPASVMVWCLVIALAGFVRHRRQSR